MGTPVSKEAKVKRSYSPPTLKVFGRVADLTAAGTVGTSEPTSGPGASDPSKKI